MLLKLEEEVPRRVRATVLQAAAEFPVVVLQGPRSVGKSTLLRELASAWQRPIVDLDDLATRDAVSREPGLFVAGEGPILVDEFQQVPTILDAIKAQLNKGQAPGMFVITGSARYDSLPRPAQSLTGRVRRMNVFPLSQGEIAGVEENLIADLLGDRSTLTDRRASTTARHEYAERVTTGGFPVVLQLPTVAARANWFDEYVDLVLNRDVVALSKIRQRRQLPLLLDQLAAQTASVVNVAATGSAIGLDKGTAEDYIQLLEAVFMVRRVPAWGTTLGSRVASTPKLHIIDSGIAARRMRITPDKLVQASASALTEFGHLLKTFVVGEIYKQIGWLDDPVDVGHFRTRDGEEVDLVLERDDGSVLGIEVKASARVSGAGKGLAALKRRAGATFTGGVLFYLGEHVVQPDEAITALPVDRLWTG